MHGGLNWANHWFITSQCLDGSVKGLELWNITKREFLAYACGDFSLIGLKCLFIKIQIFYLNFYICRLH